MECLAQLKNEYSIVKFMDLCLQEAEKNKNGTADHSMWRNYDDLNEFFWSEHSLSYDS